MFIVTSLPFVFLDKLQKITVENLQLLLVDQVSGLG
jgi:hypothetical protein